LMNFLVLMSQYDANAYLGKEVQLYFIKVITNRESTTKKIILVNKLILKNKRLVIYQPFVFI
jgi:hypothetical protein